MKQYRWKLKSVGLLALAIQNVLAAPVLTENFDVKQAPTGWSVVAADSGWVFDDPNNLVGQLKFPSNLVSVSFSSGRSELQTPTLDFTNSPGVLLKFKHFVWRQDNSVSLIQVSTDGGATWSVVKTYSADLRRGLASEAIDLSAVAGGKNNVKIAFVSENMKAWAIDDVVIEGQAVPTVPTNLSVSLGRNSAVNLMWQSNEENTGFIIERAGADGNFQSITPTPINAKNSTDDGVESKATYQYRVAAKNAGGVSAFSEPMSITTEDRTVKTYDLLVSYYDTYANTFPAKQAIIEENIKYMADAVYEMSNGAHKLGKVTVYTDGAKRDTADIVWEKEKGDDGANCWFNAYTGGRIAEKGPAKRIQHCDIGGGMDHYNTLKNTKMGGYTLAHEFGHYFYKLLDEYAQGATPPKSAGSPSSSDNAVEFSVMNSQTQAESGDFRWLNFSTSLNNKGNNAQFRVYEASAWDTLLRDPQTDSDAAKAYNSGFPRIFYPELQKVAPKTGEAPSIELTQPNAPDIARKDLKFIWKQGAIEAATRRLRLGNQPAAVVAVLDVSQSVSAEQLDSVKTAVKQWIQDANVGDYVSVVTTDGNSHIIQPLTKTLSTAAKEALNTAVDGIQTSTGMANLAAGLQTALDQLKTAPESYSGAVYLLTVGDNAVGSDPLKILTNFQDQGVLLHTIGLSDQPDSAGLLSKLAEDTNGLYWQSNGALEDVAAGLDEADQYTSPAINVTIAQEAKVISGEQLFDFYADDGLGRINFRATYTGNPQDATLTLTNPAGESISLSGDYCQTTSESAIKQSVCGVTLDYIARGMWKLKVKANVPSLDFNYHVQGVAKDNNKVIYANVEAAGSEKVTFPKPLLITANIGNNHPITGLTISAILETPDGRKQPFILRDDGVAPDDRANDGTYLGKVNYTMNGLHKITVHFSNPDNKANYTNEGVTYVALPEGVPMPPAFTPVGIPFSRIATANVHIDGVPPNLAINSTGTALGGSTTTASFSNHVQTSTGKVGNGAVISGTEKIRLASTISPDKKHLEQSADVLIAASYKPAGAPEILFFRNGDNWEAFNSLIPSAYRVEKLSDSLTVEIIEAPLGSLGLKGDFKVFAGYRLNDGAIIFNGANPLQFSVK